MFKHLSLFLALTFVIAACGEDEDTNNASNNSTNNVTNNSNNDLPDQSQTPDQGDEPDASPDLPATEDIEIAGEWDDNFGGMTTITPALWGADSIVEVDNDDNVAIIQVAPTDMYNPNKFARYVWTEPDNGAFYFCTESFGKDTAAEAKSDPTTADATDPATSGCGGAFPWTMMTAR